MWGKVVCMSKEVWIHAYCACECVHGHLASYKLCNLPEDWGPINQNTPNTSFTTGSSDHMQRSSGEILKKNRWFPHQDSHQQSIKARSAPSHPEPPTPIHCWPKVWPCPHCLAKLTYLQPGLIYIKLNTQNHTKSFQHSTKRLPSSKSQRCQSVILFLRAQLGDCMLPPRNLYFLSTSLMAM